MLLAAGALRIEEEGKFGIGMHVWRKAFNS
jgi:hypothetical protein